MSQKEEAEMLAQPQPRRIQLSAMDFQFHVEIMGKANADWMHEMSEKLFTFSSFLKFVLHNWPSSELSMRCTLKH